MTDARARRIVLLMGAVGAGKGTQAVILADRLGVPHVSSGDLFREAVRRGSPLGDKASEYMTRGDLVPDEITVGLVTQRLAQEDAAEGAILDGFPRTFAQAAALDRTLAQRGDRVSRVIMIEVPEEELVRRVAGRRICPICKTSYHLDWNPPRVAERCDREGARLDQRDDDRPEVFGARLAKQVPPMLEVVAHYERQPGVVTRVDGTKAIEEVTSDILELLGGTRAGLAG
ncbi:MAG: adenylate kinase [Candidatus Limnocylindria bacterium]